jgi:hypothetical protein
MRLGCIGLGVVSLLFVAGVSHATSIQDRPEYRASTDIYFEDLSDSLQGGQALGHTPTSGEYQINLKYYSAVPSDELAVEAFNDHDGGQSQGLNWGDANQYAVSLVVGGAQVWSDNTYVTDADWALTGAWGAWQHTIFYGDWHDIDSSAGISSGDYLEINPPGYHAFPGEGWANANEVFSLAVIPTEIHGYTVYDAGSQLGLLSVNIVPEPSTALLLTAGLAGFSVVRPRRSKRTRG